MKRFVIVSTPIPQGSFLVYPIDPEDRDDTTCQITNGVPKNSPVKVLVRVYIVKVVGCFCLSLSLSEAQFAFKTNKFAFVILFIFPPACFLLNNY